MNLAKLLLTLLTITSLISMCGCIGGDNTTPSTTNTITHSTNTNEGAPPTHTTQASATSSQSDNPYYKAPPAWAVKYIPKEDKTEIHWCVTKINKIDWDMGLPMVMIGTPVAWSDYEAYSRYGSGIVPEGTTMIGNNTMIVANFLRGNNISWYKLPDEDKQWILNECIKVSKECYNWEVENIKGKEVLYGTSNYGITEDGKDIYIELIKNGYIYIPSILIKSYYDENGGIYYHNKDLKEKIDAQNYAKEHKLGVWSIDLSRLEVVEKY